MIIPKHTENICTKSSYPEIIIVDCPKKIAKETLVKIRFLYSNVV